MSVSIDVGAFPAFVDWLDTNKTDFEALTANSIVVKIKDWPPKDAQSIATLTQPQDVVLSAPPPPPLPSLGGASASPPPRGGERADLFAAIRGGANLKEAPQRNNAPNGTPKPTVQKKTDNHFLKNANPRFAKFADYLHATWDYAGKNLNQSKFSNPKRIHDLLLNYNGELDNTLVTFQSMLNKLAAPLANVPDASNGLNHRTFADACQQIAKASTIAERLRENPFPIRGVVQKELAKLRMTKKDKGGRIADLIVIFERIEERLEHGVRSRDALLKTHLDKDGTALQLETAFSIFLVNVSEYHQKCTNVLQAMVAKCVQFCCIHNNNAAIIRNSANIMSNMLTPLDHIARVTLTEQQDWWLPICAYVVADTRPNANETETEAYIGIMTTVLEQLYPTDFKPATFERTFKNSVYPCGILLKERVKADDQLERDKLLRKIVTRMQKEIVKSTPKQRPPFDVMQSFLIHAALISVDGESEVYATFEETFLDILNNCAMVTDPNDKIKLQNWIFGNDHRTPEPSIMYLLNTEVRRAWCAFLKAYYNEPTLNDPSAFATMNEFQIFFNAKHAHFVDQYCNAYSNKKLRTVDSSTLNFDGEWDTTVFVPVSGLKGSMDVSRLDACAMNVCCKWTRAELEDTSYLETIFAEDSPTVGEEPSIAVQTADAPFMVREPLLLLNRLTEAPTRLTIVEYLNLLLHSNAKCENELLNLNQSVEVLRYEDAIPKLNMRTFGKAAGPSPRDSAIKAYVEALGLSEDEAAAQWKISHSAGTISSLVDAITRERLQAAGTSVPPLGPDRTQEIEQLKRELQDTKKELQIAKTKKPAVAPPTKARTRKTAVAPPPRENLVAQVPPLGPDRTQEIEQLKRELQDTKKELQSAKTKKPPAPPPRKNLVAQMSTIEHNHAVETKELRAKIEQLQQQKLQSADETWPAPPPTPENQASAVGRDHALEMKKLRAENDQLKQKIESAETEKSSPQPRPRPSATMTKRSIPVAKVPAIPDNPLHTLLPDVTDTFAALVNTLTAVSTAGITHSTVAADIESLNLKMDNEEAELSCADPATLHGIRKSRKAQSRRLHALAKEFCGEDGWKCRATELYWNAEANDMIDCMSRRLTYLMIGKQ